MKVKSMQINIPDEDIEDLSKVTDIFLRGYIRKDITNHHSKSKEKMIWPVQEVLERKAG